MLQDLHIGKTCVLLALSLAMLILPSLVSEGQGLTQRNLPSLVMVDGTEGVTIALSNLSGYPKLRLERLEIGSDKPIREWKNLESTMIVDHPESGRQWRYRLLSDDKLILERGLDLRIESSVAFVSGSTKRGLFRLTYGARVREFVVSKGERLASSFAPENEKIEIFESKAQLLDLRLLDGVEESQSRLAIYAPDGNASHGLDGNPLQVQTIRRQRNTKKQMVALVRLDGKRYELREGSSIVVPLTLRRK